jgi:hypothetical protein
MRITDKKLEEIANIEETRVVSGRVAAAIAKELLETRKICKRLKTLEKIKKRQASAR